jgi:1-aminocyclopropane-1-carboxylate deaminase
MLSLPNIPIDQVSIRGVSFDLLRLDLIDPVTGGNKWFKLKYNLETFREGGYESIVSFGGAWSNHLAALAEMCRREEIPVTAIVRGERAAELSPTLQRALASGMQLKFVSREEYRQFRSGVLKPEMFFAGKILVIPEGGANEAGIKGCGEIISLIPSMYSQVLLPVGTGGTMAGILKPYDRSAAFTGIKVLEAKQEQLIHSSIGEKVVRWSMEDGYTFGRYAAVTDELRHFVDEWNSLNTARIEPIYTGKMCFAIVDMINKGRFGENDRILGIHTGGMQYLSH